MTDSDSERVPIFITFPCASCERELYANPGFVGNHIACPHCTSRTVVPFKSIPTKEAEIKMRLDREKAISVEPHHQKGKQVNKTNTFLDDLKAEEELDNARRNSEKQIAPRKKRIWEKLKLQQIKSLIKQNRKESILVAGLVVYMGIVAYAYYGDVIRNYRSNPIAHAVVNTLPLLLLISLITGVAMYVFRKRKG